MNNLEAFKFFRKAGVEVDLIWLAEYFGTSTPASRPYNSVISRLTDEWCFFNGVFPGEFDSPSDFNPVEAVNWLEHINKFGWLGRISTIHRAAIYYAESLEDWLVWAEEKVTELRRGK